MKSNLTSVHVIFYFLIVSIFYMQLFQYFTVSICHKLHYHEFFVTTLKTNKKKDIVQLYLKVN